MPETVEPLVIDIISDVMCPWCYIGKRRLEKALAMRPDQPVDVRWRPYQLDATIPREGMDRQAYLDRKFGGPEGEKAVYDPIREAGRQEGIAFAFDAIPKSPNTIDPHRLLRWAQTAGVQNKVAEILFRKYFTEGQDIGDRMVLVEAAKEAGMDSEIVDDLLKGDQDRDLVKREVAQAHEMGVTGVPCFIVANKYVVMGAQGPDILAGAIDLALKPDSDGETAGQA